MNQSYQGKPSKSNAKFRAISKRDLPVHMPLPGVEVRSQLKAEMEKLTG